MEVALPARRLPRAPAPAPLLTGQMPTHSSCSHGCRSMTAGLPTRVLRQHSADPGEPHCPQCFGLPQPAQLRYVPAAGNGATNFRRQAFTGRQRNRFKQNIWAAALLQLGNAGTEHRCRVCFQGTLGSCTRLMIWTATHAKQMPTRIETSTVQHNGVSIRMLHVMTFIFCDVHRRCPNSDNV